jgi:hypothetical protein
MSLSESPTCRFARARPGVLPSLATDAIAVQQNVTTRIVEHVHSSAFQSSCSRAISASTISAIACMMKVCAS